MSKGGSKTTSTSSSALDPASQAYVDKMRGAASTAAGNIMGGGPYFAGPTQGFNMGMGMLQDAPGTAAKFMDPYQSQVVDAVHGDFDRQRAGAMMGAAQGATAAGAWGGSRSGVLQANALNNVNQNEASTLAGLRSQGYNNAMNFGLQTAGGLLGAGETERNAQSQVLQSPVYAAQNGMGLWNMGMGPTGFNSTSTQEVKNSPNVAGLVMGGLSTAAGLGWNPLAGAGGGGGAPPAPNIFPGGMPSYPNPGFGGGGAQIPSYGGLWR